MLAGAHACDGLAPLCDGACVQASTQYVESLFAEEMNAVVAALGNPSTEPLQELLCDEAGAPVRRARISLTNRSSRTTTHLLPRLLRATAVCGRT